MPRRNPTKQPEAQSAEDQIENQVLATEIWTTGREKDDDTRQEVAKKFVKYYFLLLSLILIGIPAYNYFIYELTSDNALMLPLKDIILTYSAVVGPTMGLVVAYYFKTTTEE